MRIGLKVLELFVFSTLKLNYIDQHDRESFELFLGGK